MQTNATTQARPPGYCAPVATHRAAAPRHRPAHRPRDATRAACHRRRSVPNARRRVGRHVCRPHQSDRESVGASFGQAIFPDAARAGCTSFCAIARQRGAKQAISLSSVSKLRDLLEACPVAGLAELASTSRRMRSPPQYPAVAQKPFDFGGTGGINAQRSAQYST